ncbi:MAG TPA: iron chelate uptake ABC transporter family permease subunit, partial [Ktedonobacteraceae bacterium]|nr:iron chelate uptake ABC transporter family permease subunit [Ktedonobacteraceae bacterium]
MKLATPSTQLKRQEKEAGRRLLPTPLAVLILGALLLACIFLAVSFGSIAIPVGTIAQILLNGTGIFHFARHWDPTAEKIVWQVRMPIVIGAACVGAALSTAGVLFQGMLRNPLAD